MKLRLFALFLVLLLCIPPLTACGEGENTFVLYNKLNTDVSITLYSGGTQKKQAELSATLTKLENVWDTFHVYNKSMDARERNESDE